LGWSCAAAAPASPRTTNSTNDRRMNFIVASPSQRVK
jgi:hypothetical protein